MIPQCWAVKNQYIQKISGEEMRILRWMTDKTLRDMIRIEDKMRDDNMRENRLTWFRHVQDRLISALVKKK